MGQFLSIFYSGTKYATDMAQSKKIVLCNQIIVLMASLTFVESIIYVCLGLYEGAFFTCLLCFLYGFCFYFNRRGYIKFTRVLLLVLLNGAIFIISSSLGYQFGMQYVYFLAMVIPLIIFDNKQYISKVIFVGSSFVCFLVLDFVGYGLFYPLSIPVEFEKAFYLLVILASGASLVGICLMVMSLYGEKQQELQQFLKSSNLTTREIEIVAKIIEGYSNKVIGELLYIEESTVKRHVKHIFQKLNVKKRTELMAFALKK